jgi:hypothetical protein
MLNLYQKSTPYNYQLKFSFEGQEYDISYDIESKGDDLFIAHIQYKGANENFILNSYLNLLMNRGVAVLDRVSIKELDYFLRDIPSQPYFSKITPELLKILELGEKIKGIHLMSHDKEEVVYDEKTHGPFEFMSYGEKLELIEEALASESLKDYALECLELKEDLSLILSSKRILNSDDQHSIELKITELLKNKFKVEYEF